MRPALRLYIDHSRCQHEPSDDERCLAATLLRPENLPSGCGSIMEDDHRAEVMAILVIRGIEHSLVLRSRREVEFAAADGSAAFLRGRLAKIGL